MQRACSASRERLSRLPVSRKSKYRGGPRKAREIPKIHEPDDLQQARLRDLARVVELRRAAEPCLGVQSVCSMLSLTREALVEMVETSQILALPNGPADWVFPAFQFQNAKVVSGLREVLEVIGTASPFPALGFLLARFPDLSNQTAIQALRGGRVREVLARSRSAPKA